MPTSSMPPWTSRDLLLTLTGNPAVRTLDSFAIPYVAIAAAGSMRHASPAAAELLRAHDGLWTHILRALEIHRGRTLAPGAGPHRLSSYGPYALNLTWTDVPSGYLGLVLIQPAVSTRLPDAPALGALTIREQEIAYLIASGESAKRIACALAISEHTVRHHTERIFAKLGVRSRAAVAGIAGGGQLVQAPTLARVAAGL